MEAITCLTQLYLACQERFKARHHRIDQIKCTNVPTLGQGGWGISEYLQNGRRIGNGLNLSWVPTERDKDKTFRSIGWQYNHGLNCFEGRTFPYFSIKVL